MQEIERPAIRKARQQLQALSDDEQARYLAFVRERALLNETIVMGATEAKGKREGRSDILRQLLQLKFGALPVAIEQRLVTASETEQVRWAERILSVDSLEQVFAE
ncbi:hypothetical protein [Stutzerimonas kirkiae]|nr:hypothetical protein [Stutzerimonas kirkiae]